MFAFFNSVHIYFTVSTTCHNQRSSQIDLPSAKEVLYTQELNGTSPTGIYADHTVPMAISYEVRASIVQS